MNPPTLPASLLKIAGFATSILSRSSMVDFVFYFLFSLYFIFIFIFIFFSIFRTNSG